MPEKNELVSSTLQSKSACEEALEEREARACLSTKARGDKATYKGWRGE